MSDRFSGSAGPSEPRGKVVRYAGGSRVPGWDDAVDLAKDPAVVPDPASTPVPDSMRAEIEAHAAKYPDAKSAAIPALFVAQRHHGWLKPEGVVQVAAVLGLTPAYLQAVASFYDMFELKPAGEHTIYVCTNISCTLRGADRVYDRMQQAVGDDPAFNVRHFECLGACDIAPMASVNGQYVGPLDDEDCDTIVDDLRAGRVPLEDKQIARRPTATDL